MFLPIDALEPGVRLRRVRVSRGQRRGGRKGWPYLNEVNAVIVNGDTGLSDETASSGMHDQRIGRKVDEDV